MNLENQTTRMQKTQGSNSVFRRQNNRTKQCSKQSRLFSMTFKKTSSHCLGSENIPEMFHTFPKVHGLNCFTVPSPQHLRYPRLHLRGCAGTVTDFRLISSLFPVQPHSVYSGVGCLDGFPRGQRKPARYHVTSVPQLLTQLLL